MLHYIHSSLIYNSQELGRTQMSFNRGMNTENMFHLQNGVLTQILKNDEFMKFLSKWVELENIILREVTQLQKNTHGTPSQMDILQIHPFA